MGKIPETPLTRRYVRYLLAFGVSVGVGLAPLLGAIDVPGFTPILALFPLNLRQTLIPFAAFLMSIPAVALQFYSKSHVTVRLLQRLFALFLAAVLVFATACMVAFTMFAAEVPYSGGRAVARYVIGEHQTADSPCHGRPIETCVGQTISFNPTRVEACFDPRELRVRKLILSLLYIGTMMSFGGLIGLLILREVQHERR